MSESTPGPSSEKKDRLRKKSSADQVLRDIFDPVTKSGLATQEPEAAEASVFFQPKSVPPPAPPPPKVVAPPVEIKPILPQKSSLGIFIAAALAIFLAGSVFILLRWMKEDVKTRRTAQVLLDKQKEAGNLEKKLSEVKTEEERFKALTAQTQAQKKSQEEKVGLLESQMRRKSTADFLWQVGRARPPEVWFRRISLGEEGRLTIRGFSLAPNFVERFVEALLRAGLLKARPELSLEKSGPDAHDFYTFEIKGHVA